MAKTIRRVDKPLQPGLIARKRVCGYARVSVATERLLHSLDEQISYYSELIQKTPGWEYAGVFADRGISGTQSETRDQFLRMLAECEAGNIDIILTKSISRFARNTVDTLETVRRLKALGIEVRFEKEGINTMDESGELMITLFASFAQEESRSISENCKWGIRKRFENGTIGVTNKHILGYQYDEELKKYIIIPEEAEVVRQMFDMFLAGATLREICWELNLRGYRTVWGNLFQEASLAQLIQNEIYVGDIRRQKSHIPDPISKKKIRNRGELPQYYYENAHEGILDRETWERVQAEYARRRKKLPPSYCFTGMITCELCGLKFTRKAQYKKDAGNAHWFCRGKKEFGRTCTSPCFTETTLKSVCAKVLGLEEFDEEAFKSLVRQMTVTADGSIDFELINGQNAHWRNRRIEACRHPATVTDAFQGCILCGICHDAYHRVNSGGRRVSWYCYGKRRKGGCCTNTNYPDYVLRQITAEIMGTEDFEEEAFLEKVDFIEAAAGSTLIFHFKDGSTAQWQKT